MPLRKEGDECPICGEGHISEHSEVITREEARYNDTGTRLVLVPTFTYTSISWVCDKCDSDFCDARQMDINHDEYQKNRNIAKMQRSQEVNDVSESTSGTANSGDA